MFCIELSMVLMDELMMLMIGATRVVVLDAFAEEIEIGCVVRIKRYVINATVQRI